MNFQLCTHGMNQKSCPTCYRLAPVAATPTGKVVAIDEAKRRHEELLARAQEQLAASQAIAAKKAQEAKKAGVDAGPMRVLAPFSSTDESAGSFDETGLWTPPDRRDIIDRAPRHPHADAAPFKVLNPMPLIPKV